jgi:sugar phosphate permease
MDARDRQRFFLSVFFFLSGFCFASWASRIPTIKTTFGYNDAELGTILLCMPISSLIGLPVSGWLVSRYDSRIPLIGRIYFTGHASISFIGFSNSSSRADRFCLSVCFRPALLNISMNTQAITLQKKFERRINGSFHGLWSTGGILGVGFSTLLVAMKTTMDIHLLIVADHNAYSLP